MERLSLDFEDVSVSNGVEVVPMPKGGGVDEIVKTHDMLILGSDFLFKMNVEEVDHPETSFYHNFKNWVSYVLFAGIIKLSLKKSKIDLKLGISLTDFYQNHARFANVIRKKSLRYFLSGVQHRKSIEFLNIDLYPSIYAQGLFLNKIYDLSNFIVVRFSRESFEGMVFDVRLGFLNQKYVVGKGYDYFLTKFQSDLEITGENEQDTKVIPYTFEAFLEIHFQKKLNYLFKGSDPLKVFVINDNFVEQTDFNKYVQFVTASREFLIVDGGANVACHGLFETYSNTYHSKMERVAVSVDSDKSTFLCRKNHGFKYNTRRAGINKHILSPYIT